MSLAIVGGSAEPELWFLIPSPSSSNEECPRRQFATMERRAARRSGPHHRKVAAAMHAEQKQQPRRPQGTWTGTSRGHGPPPVTTTAPGYFTAELVLAFLFVAVSLAFLPLVLPPLSPPPFLLLLVPVGLLAVLVALAFVPLDAQSHLVGSSR